MPIHGEYAPGSSAWARDQAERYEASAGADAGDMRGMPIVVVTNVGATTGKLRKTALMRVEHRGRYLAVGSKGGAPESPAWCRNLAVNPHCELQDGPVRRDYRARELAGEERAAWWARAVAAFPDYATYQTKTARLIPLYLLEAIEEGAGAP